MSTRYQTVAEGGVFDHETARRIRRGEPGWAEYQEWLTRGGSPLLPDPVGEMDLAAAKAARIADINAHAAGLRNQFVRGRSVGEMVSWSIKLLDAIAVQAGQPTPFAALLPQLQAQLGLPVAPDSVNHALALLRGITEAEHAGKVISQAAAALAAEIASDAIRGRHCDSIATMTDPRDIAAYPWLTGWPSMPGG